MVPLKDRLCTPEQAIFFKQQGIRQEAVYAWERAEKGYRIVFDTDEAGLPKLIDWSEDEGCFAAFDATDLGLLLAPIGYYPSGPSHQMPHESPAYRWWCEDINSFKSIEDTLYQGYGATEAEAKARMLEKLLRTEKVPADYPYRNTITSPQNSD